MNCSRIFFPTWGRGGLNWTGCIFTLCQCWRSEHTQTHSDGAACLDEQCLVHPTTHVHTYGLCLTVHPHVDIIAAQWQQQQQWQQCSWRRESLQQAGVPAHLAASLCVTTAPQSTWLKQLEVWHFKSKCHLRVMEQQRQAGHLVHVQLGSRQQVGVRCGRRTSYASGKAGGATCTGTLAVRVMLDADCSSDRRPAVTRVNIKAMHVATTSAAALL